MDGDPTSVFHILVFIWRLVIIQLFMSDKSFFFQLNIEKLMSPSVDWELCLKTECLPAGIYLVKVNNRNTRTVCGRCFVINFEQVIAGWFISPF